MIFTIIARTILTMLKHGESADPVFGGELLDSVTAALVYGHSRPTTFSVTPLKGLHTMDVTESILLVSNDAV